MPNSKATPAVPVAGLRLQRHDDRSFTLAGSGVTLTASALAPDLFRLRVGGGRRPVADSSWAVVARDWPAPAASVQVGRARVHLQTGAGRLSVAPATGAWEVADAGGLKLFSAAAGATAFAGMDVRLSLGLAEGESLFGLGEATGQFNRRGLVRDLWNIDVLGHAPAIHPALQQLYVSIPFAISLRDGRAAGLFWDNPARQQWDLGQTRLDTWQMTAAGGGLDLYLFLGPGVADVCRRYAELTGHMPLPPRWGLGYQQSRYSYETQERVEAIAREFRRRDLPCDVLHLDIHHMDAHRVFTFGTTFPQPAAMMKRLAKRGFKVVAIVDPGVKNDPKFGVLRRGAKAGAFVRDPSGKKDYLGRVWPGVARFPDFLNAGARAWWGEEQRALLDAGVSGFWNDMNEPANFARPDKTLDPRCRHATDLGPRRHHQVHNLYGQQMARASRDGALRTRPHERPLVITRAGYAGIQRHALVWTGDNSSHWDHLNDAVQMCLNLSLSGVPFCGSDVGGFLGNTAPELFVRWFQFATFTPFFRNHTNLGTIPQEPWAFGARVEEICRHCLTLRYQLLPYLYGRFAEARTSGAPIMRPMLWHYQNDPVAVACGDQFLLGRDLLVAPVLRQGAVARSVHLPNDVWFNFWTGERLAGGRHVVADAPLDTIPLFVRAGGIVPLGPRQHYVGELPTDTLLLHCWPGAAGELAWYEDDGTTNAYESGHCLRRTLTSTTRGRTFRLQFGAATGSYTSEVKTWKLILWNVSRPSRFTVNGRRAEGAFGEEQGVFIADIANTPGPITVEFSAVRSG